MRTRKPYLVTAATVLSFRCGNKSVDFRTRASLMRSWFEEHNNASPDHFSTSKQGGILPTCPRCVKWRRGAAARGPMTVQHATLCTFHVDGTTMASARSRVCMTTAIARQGRHRAGGGGQHLRRGENVNFKMK